MKKRLNQIGVNVVNSNSIDRVGYVIERFTAYLIDVFWEEKRLKFNK